MIVTTRPAAHAIEWQISQPVTSFVGPPATTTIKRALEEPRIVTLTGVGGVAQVAPALHAAQPVHRNFPDGVHSSSWPRSMTRHWSYTRSPTPSTCEANAVPKTRSPVTGPRVD